VGTTLEVDQELLEQYAYVCGVDEAGRGPLAGPVYAAAVILPRGVVLDGLNDSKKLTEKTRERLYDEICRTAISWSVAFATGEEIDRLNILNATYLAMNRAIEGLSVKPDFALIDGNRSKGIILKNKTVVAGDGIYACIAAASVLAKVSRDRYMKALSRDYPQYEFHVHKGYPTKLHYERIRKYGLSPVHRRSFLKNFA
jgi:ribonuclease HII